MWFLPETMQRFLKKFSGIHAWIAQAICSRISPGIAPDISLKLFFFRDSSVNSSSNFFWYPDSDFSLDFYRNSFNDSCKNKFKDSLWDASRNFFGDCNRNTFRYYCKDLFGISPEGFFRNYSQNLSKISCRPLSRLSWVMGVVSDTW